MYIIHTKYGNFGPFKTHRASQRWMEKLPADVKTSAWTQVLYEPLEWSLIQKVLTTDGGSTQMTSDTTSENSGSTPIPPKTSANSKSG